jgi:high-affinity Fe2+/Pb2+ permease
VLGSAVLVLREVLECALVVSVVSAATRGVPECSRWIAAGVVAAGLGASAVALCSGAIANAAAGMGQDLFNATILLAAVDTSALLFDRSLLGHALRALIGYDARPAGVQILFYAVTGTLIIIGMRLWGKPGRKMLGAH